MKTKRLPIRNLWLALAILLIGQNLAARQITVQGTVRDTARHPLPGVTVLVKHASTGTVTGADGRYAIPASVGDTLVFRVQLLTEIRRGIATMRGLAFVGGQVVCEAEFTAQIAKNRG